MQWELSADEIPEISDGVLGRGCGAAEVTYKDKVGWTVLFEMAYSHDWPKAAAAVIERGCDVLLETIISGVPVLTEVLQKRFQFPIRNVRLRVIAEEDDTTRTGLGVSE